MNTPPLSKDELSTQMGLANLNMPSIIFMGWFWMHKKALQHDAGR